MNKSYLFLPFFFSIFCATSFLNVAAVGLGESIAAGGAAYKIGKYAYDYLFSTAENQEITKKHLPAHSHIAQACDKYLSQSCITLATHYRNLEEYHKVTTLQGELDKIENPELQEVIQRSLAKAKKNKQKMNLPDDTGTYWESLSEEGRTELKNLFQQIIEENIYGIDNYAQELTYLYDSLNQ